MTINYKIQGTPNSPVLVFSNSLGSEMMMWDDLVSHLLPFFRVVQYDTRGHGKSEITNRTYTIQQLGEDVITLMNTLEINKFSFCVILKFRKFTGAKNNLFPIFVKCVI